MSVGKNRLCSTVLSIFAMLPPAPGEARTHDSTTMNYESISRELINYSTLSEKEVEDRKLRAANISEMIKEENRLKKKSMEQSRLSFEMRPVERIMATYNGMRTLNHYRSDEKLLYSPADTIRDLEFFDPKTGGLFKRLDRTQTAAGSLILASKLHNPLVDINAIKDRNRALEEFKNNQELRVNLTKLVGKFHSIQDQVLSFWTPDSEFNIQVNTELYFKNPAYNTESNLYRYFHTLPIFKGVAGLAVTAASAQALAHKYSLSVKKGTLLSRIYSGITNLPSLLRFPNGGHIPNHSVDLVLHLNALFSAGFCLNGSYNSFLGNPKHTEMIKMLRNRGIAAATLVKSARGINILISQNPILAKVFKNDDLFDDIKNDPNAYDDDYKEVLDSIYNNKEYSSGMNAKVKNSGLVLVNDMKLRGTLHSFARMFELIGETDAYLSITDLLLEDEVNKTRYSIPNPIKLEKTDDPMQTIDEPVLKIKDFWHPMLNRQNAVTNSISMEKGFRGIILTGSNTGGKSTSLKGMLMSALLAQSWGIVPASHMIFTPFAFIGSFMNITDNIATRASLFQSEVDQAKNLIHVSKSVARAEAFGLVVMDELFTGTNPEMGEIGTYNVAEKIFMNPRLITLFATHYKKMTTLPEKYLGRDKEPNQVQNYKLDVTKHPTKPGRYVHTYKLVPGISQVDYANYLFTRDL